MKMIIELLIVLVVLIGFILFLLYKIFNNKYNIIYIKISKSEKKLMESFKNKFNLLLKAIDFLNDKKNFDENLYHDFLNLNLEEITLNDLNDTLIDTELSIENYLSENEKIINNKDFKEIYKEIKEINITIDATRKYYNENLKDYNQFAKKFPTSILAKLKKLTEKDILKNDEEKKLKIFN